MVSLAGKQEWLGNKGEGRTERTRAVLSLFFAKVSSSWIEVPSRMVNASGTTDCAAHYVQEEVSRHCASLALLQGSDPLEGCSKLLA